jgi:hypothetical protein
MKPAMVANNIPMEIFASRGFVTLLPSAAAKSGTDTFSLGQ